MGKITEVMYREIDPSICSTYKAGEYYFFFNMLGVDPILDNEYLKYEEDQVNIRNNVIREYINKSKKHPKVDKSIFGISSIKNKAVIISEY